MNIPDILYFPYFGPSRRSDRRVVEARVDFSAPGAPLPDGPETAGRTAALLLREGIIEADEAFPETAPSGAGDAGFAAVLAQTCLLFQRKAHHRVSFWEARPRHHACGQWLVLVEHEHCDVGMTAMKLAVELMRGQRSRLAEPFGRFLEFAHERRLPRETEALIGAAERRGIPWLNLDRAPFTEPAKRADPVRPNGLLQLGHGARSRVLDGSFCTTLADELQRNIRGDVLRRKALLVRLGLDPSILHPSECGGPRLHLLAVAGQVHAPEQGCDETYESLALALQRELGGQTLELELVRENAPEGADAGRIVAADFSLGPDLAQFANGDEGVLATLAERQVDGLLPGPENGRIPVVAVTGTNGKTTTCRMIARMFRQAGWRTGLVCTDGIFLDDARLAKGDRGTITGHGALLTHRGLEAAVLESHHRGIAVRGFAFRHCDVGVALNVTREHLQRGEVETVEEMAEIKRAVVERAAKAAVLFADDPHCAAMPAHVPPGTLWLVSLQDSRAELARRTGGRLPGCGVLERTGEDEILVIYDGSRRVPLLPPGDIPATLGGTARFNVSNALHAAVAAYNAGVPAADICSALRSFGARPEDTPGRLNVYDRFSFRIVVDFAHNPDGLRKICDFADRQAPAGRKVIAFASPSNRGLAAAHETGRVAAGHFDAYFCKDYTPRPGYEDEPVAPEVKKGLLEGGVPEDGIQLTSHGRAAAFEVFSFCRPGDLLIYLVGHVELVQMEEFMSAYAASLPPDHPALAERTAHA